MAGKNRLRKIVIIIVLIVILMVAAFLVLDIEKEELDDQVRASINGSFADLSNGAVYYNFSSSNKGPLVVLVHGFSTPSYIWEPTFEFLDGKGYRVLSFDLYGRGFSDRPDADYNLAFYANQIRELLQELDVDEEEINIVGLSFGGPIVAAYTNKYPDKIHTMVLIDPYTSPATKKEIFPLNVPFVGEYIMRVYLAPFMLPNSQPDDFYEMDSFSGWEEKYREQLQYKGFQKAILSTIRNMVHISGIEEYKSIQKLAIPVLLIWGKEDQSIPFEDMQSIISVLPDVEFYPIEKAAHLPHYERPEIVNPIIQDFLEKNN